MAVSGEVRGEVAPRRPDLFWDVVLAVAVTVFGQLDLRLDFDNSTLYGPPWAAVLCTLAATGALVLRRRAPLATAAVVAAAVAGPQLFTVLTFTLWGDFLPILVAAYAVARYTDGRRAVGGLLAIGAATAVVMLRVPSVNGDVANIPFALVPLVVVTALGRGLQRWQRSHAALSLHASRLAEDQEAWVRDAVAAERARIARELHDVVAHCVSVMVIQAGAAEDLLDRDPGAARTPLRAVQDTGQQAVAELARMLGLLRGESAQDALVPQPGVGQLPELVAQVHAAGLAVDIEVEGTPHDLPPGVDVALFRLAQEALTNVLKHARGARAGVLVRYEESAVELRIHDDGRGVDAGPGARHGLIGMRERVALYGGTLSAGPRDGGGFVVDAVIPLGVGARATTP
jgi:signal transduction histidine kinase